MRVLALVVALLVAAAISPAPARSAEAEIAPACADPGHREFDFWMGHWAVTAPSGQDLGFTDNTPMAGGCGFLETVHDAHDGPPGIAYNVFDQHRRSWTQLWSAPGSVVRLEGARQPDGRIVAIGTILFTAQNVERLLRVTWVPETDDSVRQEFEVRDTEASDWTRLFVRIYRRVT